jgi:hyperosmotically inducible protein
MKRTFVIICTLLAGAACERTDRQEQETTPSLLPPPAVSPGSPRTEPSQPEPGIQAPATAGDERMNMSGKDEPAAGMEHGATSETSLDRSISARVREAVTSEDALSGSAKNLSIRSVDGVVTLRGSVQSAREKDRVTELVTSIDGVKRVDNQLVISGD